MIHYCNITNKYQFSTPNHNVDNCSKKPLIYNQLFVDDQLHLLNIETGELYSNYIDLDMVHILSQHNFNADTAGRFQTRINGRMVKIYERIYGVKTNENYVINHIDGDYTNNRRSNLELVTNWFNIALMKKTSGLPIGVTYNNGSYKTAIRMPRHGKKDKFYCKICRLFAKFALSVWHQIWFSITRSISKRSTKLVVGSIDPIHYRSSDQIGSIDQSAYR